MSSFFWCIQKLQNRRMHTCTMHNTHVYIQICLHRFLDAFICCQNAGKNRYIENCSEHTIAESNVFLLYFYLLYFRYKSRHTLYTSLRWCMMLFQLNLTVNSTAMPLLAYLKMSAVMMLIVYCVAMCADCICDAHNTYERAIPRTIGNPYKMQCVQYWKWIWWCQSGGDEESTTMGNHHVNTEYVNSACTWMSGMIWIRISIKNSPNLHFTFEFNTVFFRFVFSFRLLAWKSSNCWPKISALEYWDLSSSSSKWVVWEKAAYPICGLHFLTNCTLLRRWNTVFLGQQCFNNKVCKSCSFSANQLVSIALFNSDWRLFRHTRMKVKIASINISQIVALLTSSGR